MSTNLKVAFYLKRAQKTEETIVDNTIVGKIIIGRSIAQFSTKLKVAENLWHVKSGRAIGKSKAATELNRELNKINLLIHSHHKSILKRNGQVTAAEVKNAFQGIASSQKTLLVLLNEMREEIYPRIGIDRATRTYCTYGKQNKYFQQFIRAKYNLRDIPLTQLDLPFVEKFDFYLRIERGMKPNTVLSTIFRLMSAVKVALHRNLIPHHPFLGYKFTKPEFQIRSLPPEELERIISTSVQSASLNFIRDLFVFACFTGVSYRHCIFIG